MYLYSRVPLKGSFKGSFKGAIRVLEGLGYKGPWYPNSRYLSLKGAPTLRPKYILYGYMEPLGALKL